MAALDRHDTALGVRLTLPPHPALPNSRVMNWFLWPGERVCDLVGLRDPEDRQVLRMFANTIIWGAVVVAAAVVYGLVAD